MVEKFDANIRANGKQVSYKVKMKQLVREKIWFPKIDHKVASLLVSCLACQANGPETRPDPLQSVECDTEHL